MTTHLQAQINKEHEVCHQVFFTTGYKQDLVTAGHSKYIISFVKWLAGPQYIFPDIQTRLDFTVKL